jgi:hypothetical protein
MQVVPKALLDFSRAVLRERFSSLIRKPVYTFAFDRFTPVTPEFYAKFIKARELRAVVITDPKSIKSFALKLVELCHELGRVSAGFSSSHSSSELRAQAAECVKVISIWKSSVLLMDEVDLILHPLKSELNYPVGTKEPLDFTANRIGCKICRLFGEPTHPNNPGRPRAALGTPVFHPRRLVLRDSREY